MYKKHLQNYLISNGYVEHRIFKNVSIKGEIGERFFFSIGEKRISLHKENGDAHFEIIFDINLPRGYEHDEICKMGIIKLKDYLNTINRKSRIEKLKL